MVVWQREEVLLDLYHQMKRVQFYFVVFLAEQEVNKKQSGHLLQDQSLSQVQQKQYSLLE